MTDVSTQGAVPELAQVIANQPPVNPLLAKARMPGQTFSLPSRAIFYKNGEVDDSVRVTGEIMIHPMVTMDELIMKTPDRLLNGTALTEVFGRCIPQVNQPMSLLAKDVDYLLICLRRVTYGENYTLIYQHDCENAKEHSYVIPLDSLLASGKHLTAKKALEDYKLTLENQQVVRCCPPRYSELLHLYRSIDEGKNEQELALQVIESLVSVIESVDGIDDKQMIREWAHNITAGFANSIGEFVGKLGEWGPDLTQTITCRDCNSDVEVFMSLNPINFFS